MKFLWTTIFVRDMEKSIEFYTCVAGLSVERRFKSQTGTEYAFLGDGGTQIELIKDAEVCEPQLRGDISVGFRVDSLDEKIEELQKKSIIIVDGPVQPSPAIKFLFVSDPDGLRVQFVELVK